MAEKIQNLTLRLKVDYADVPVTLAKVNESLDGLGVTASKAFLTVNAETKETIAEFKLMGNSVQSLRTALLSLQSTSAVQPKIATIGNIEETKNQITAITKAHAEAIAMDKERTRVALEQYRLRANTFTQISQAALTNNNINQLAQTDPRAALEARAAQERITIERNLVAQINELENRLRTGQTVNINALNATRTRYINEFNRAITESNARLDNARLSTAPTVTPAVNSSAIQGNTAALRENAHAIQEISLSHQSLAVRVIEVIGLYRVYNVVINSITNAIKAIPNIGIELESTKASLAATTDTGQIAGSAMAALTREANRTGISLKALRENFRTFQASTSLAGESLDTTWKIFTNLNTVITGLHLPAEKAVGIFNAIAQIFNKSRVQSEELVKQLGNLLPGAFASFAAANNRSTQQLANDLRNGLVFAHNTIENFTDFLEKRFRVSFELASQSLNSNIGRMGNSFTLLGEAIYGTTSGPMIAFTKAVTSINNYIIGAIEGTNNFGKVVNTVFNIALGTAVVLLGKFAIGLAAPLVNMALMRTAIYGVSAALVPLEAAFAFLASPVVILAGIAAIALHLHDLSSAADDAVIRINEVLTKDLENKAATTKEAKLRIEIENDAGVKAALINLNDVEKTLERINRLKRTPAGDLYYSLRPNIEKEQLTARLNAEDQLAKAITTAKEKSELKQSDVTFAHLEERARVALNVERASLENINTLKAKTRLAELTFEQQHLDDLNHLRGLKRVGEAEKASPEEKEIGIKAAREIQILEDAKVRFVQAALERTEKVHTDSASRVKSIQNKAYKDLYRDIERDSKAASEAIAADWQKLDYVYAQGKVNIQDYYDTKQDLVSRDLKQQTDANVAAFKIAFNASDIAKQNALEDAGRDNELKANKAAEQIAQERIITNKAFNDSLKETNILYLEQFDTVAALKARQTIQTPEKVKLQQEVIAGTPGALIAQNQVKAIEQNQLLKANADEAKSYREAITSIEQSYRTLGSTSQDILAQSLGGFSQLSNVLDNFIAKQHDLAIQQKEVAAEIALVKARVIPEDSPTRAADLARQTKDKETATAKGIALDKQEYQNKLGLAKQSFGQIGSMLKANSAERKAFNAAALAFDLAEKLSTLSKLPAKAVEGGLNVATSGDGYTAIARVAAYMAFAAGLIATVGGSSGSGSSSATKAFTGSSSTGTVLGDVSKTSESITNVANILKDIHASEYRELKGINEGVQTLQTGITDSITKVFRSGGIKEALVSGLGSAPTVGKNFFNTFGLDPVANFVGKFLFGTTKKEITGAGLGTAPINIGEVVKGVLIGVAQYTNVQTTKSGGLFGKKKVSNEIVLSQADAGIQESLTTVFQSTGKVMLELADAFGHGLSEKVRNYIVPTLLVELRGLSGEDAVKKLSGVLSTALDNAADAIFGNLLKQYQQLNEGMLETVSRVYIQQGVVHSLFNRIGKEFPKTILAAVGLADSLINLSSSSEKATDRLKDFIAQEDTFYDSFVSTEEKRRDLVKKFALSINDVLTLGLTKQQAITSATGSALSQAKQQQPIITTDVATAKASLKPGANTALNKAAYDQALEFMMQTFGAAAFNFVANNPVEAASFVTKKYNEILATNAVKAEAAAKANQNLIKQLEAADKVNKTAKTTYASLSDVFYKTLAATGSVAEALLQVKRNMDVTTIAGQKAYAALNQLNDINKQYVETLSSIQQPIKDQIIAIQDQIDKTSKADLLKKLAASRDINQQQTLAAKIQKLITEEYNTKVGAITNIKTSLTDLAKTVKDLLLGDLSTLSPEKKLAEASRQYNELLEKARKGDPAAVTALSTAAQNYLREAKAFYSSTAQYAAIFSSVTKALLTLSKQAGAITDPTLKVTQDLGKAAIKELQALSVTLVTVAAKSMREIIIQAGIASKQATATPTEKLLLAKQSKALAAGGEAKYLLELQREATQRQLNDRITAKLTSSEADKLKNKQLQDLINSLTVKIGFKASGGTASGLTIVGERGPELLNLPSNTNVINNNDTNRLIRSANDKSYNVLESIRDELYTLNNRIETIERKTRLGAK